MATDAPMATATDTAADTATETQILTLTQWLSPGFPVGAYAYSHGLEWLVETGDVRDVPSLSAWLRDVIEVGAGRADILFLAAAYRAPTPDALLDTDALARAFAGSAERQKETVLQGQAFSRTIADIWSPAMPELAYPVAVGWAAREQDLPLDLTARMYLHAFMSNLVSAAMRLVPLGQTDGQGVIRDFAPLCSEVAARALEQDLSDLSSNAILSDIAAMKHETQYSRIFRT